MHASTMPMIAVVAVAAIAAACLVPSAMPAHAQAAGSPPVPAGFVDPGTDPQTYVDRYHTEPSYKEWFDNNYSEYDSIYHAVGLPDPDAITSEPVTAPVRKWTPRRSRRSSTRQSTPRPTWTDTSPTPRTRSGLTQTTLQSTAPYTTRWGFQTSTRL